MQLHTTRLSLPCTAGHIHDHNRSTKSTRRHHVRLAPRASGELTSQSPHPSHAAPLSPHPDAVYRRRMAQQRHVLRQQRQTHEPAGVDQSKPPQLPANATYVTTLPALIDAQRAAITSGMLTVTYFSAPWCNACRRLQPKIAQMATNNPDVTFVQVNVADDALREFCSTQLHLLKLPYFHLYRRGRLLAHFTANLEKISLLRAEIAALKLCSDPRCESS